jgi:hypothetical protein
VKTINGAVLQVGDIVLTTSTEKVSAYIRGFTRSDISHVMICVESYSVIDANAEGVQARNTQLTKRCPTIDVGFRAVHFASATR